MTNAELIAKIKAEIESMKSIEYPCDNSQQATGFCDALDRMTDFLSTLESEKPMNPDELGKEITRTYHDGSVTDTTEMDHVDYENIARHFYDLGCRRTAEKYDEIEYNRQRAEESVPNDLEEAAEAFAFKSLDEVILYGCTLSGRRACFIAGAKWQAEQDQETIELAEDHAYFAGSVNEREKMMREAVEGVVFGNVYEHWVETGIDEKLSYLNPGDKVRVIIIKEDEK